MRLEELINSKKDLLNQTDLSIWKYIFNHRKQAGQMSIHDLAKASCVSSATLVRFAQKLGFRGFSELKASINFERPINSEYKSDVINNLKDFYGKTIDNLINRDYDSASKLIYNARRILAFPSGFVQSNVVQEMKRIFLEDNVFIYEIIGSGELSNILDSLTPEDLFICVSLSGESPIVKEFAQRLKLKGVPTISITRLSDNTLASLSTVNLYITPARFQISGDDENGVHFLTLIPFFMLVEILYLKYRIYAEQQNTELEELN